MSCFMMDPEPLAAIANATETALNCGYDYMGFHAPDELYETANGLRVCGLYDERMIYEKLYALNASAYAERYRTGNTDAAPEIDLSKHRIHKPPVYADHHHAVQSWHYHLAKLLDCWLYQTNEGMTARDPFRQAMHRFRSALFAFIVERSPEYDAAPPWGQF